ncbi:hypothetical protein ACEWY4_011521 [Coilia grayii]|uniref:DUF4524 domain-containing protein n=1 Tax=Coilia grayii TaxID=363190 RepID=A0ABD1JXX7_9TELE
MATVRLRIMYESEAVDVYFTDGSRLSLSPCGSEFLLEKALPQGAHPLQASERIRQRTRFAISDYKELLEDALRFRNKYATHPYLPEELISSSQRKWFPKNLSDIAWPTDSSPETTQPDGETILSSLDGTAKLILSSSGEEFFVEFCCRASQTEITTHLMTLLEEPSTSHNKTHQVHQSTTENKTAKDGEVCKSSPKNGPVNPSAIVETQGARPGHGYLFTTVVQHHSCASYSSNWHHPLALAISQWKTQQEKPTENRSVKTLQACNSQTCQSPSTDVPLGVKAIIPQALPLRCNSPHMHRWNTGTSPLGEDPHEAMATELVKVLWCQGVVYRRIVDGTVPIIEISPGDGSVIRSNGVLASYFTHYKAGCGFGDCMEMTYYLSNLPPDIPGQKYSVSSVVTRANRVLECYSQAKHSRKLAHMNCCWRKEVMLEPLKLVQEAHVPDWGHFLAFSDGSAEAVFLDGVKVHTMWKTGSTTTPQMLGSAQQRHSKAEQPSSWSQLTLPNGQQLLLQAETPGPYDKYLSLSAEWCSWVVQTCFSPDQACSMQSGKVHSKQTAQSRSVVAELEKIKRFNFLLENSHLIKTHRSSNVPPEDSRTSCGTTHTGSDSSISEALQKTSKAIRDIETLLSHKEYASSSPQSRGNVKNLLANFNAAPVPQPGPPSPCPPPFQHRSRMNTHTKALPNSGADSCKPNPWADRKAISRNVSSGVLKLGARFENVNDSEKTPVSKSPSPKPVVSKPPPSFIQPGFASGSSTPTVSKDSERPTFPKPSQLKPTGVSKLALNFTKPSLNTGSSTTTSTSGSSAERPIAITSSGSSAERPITPAGSVPSVPEVKPKPKALVPVGQSQLQENVQESTQKDGVKKTLSSSKVSPFLRQQQATPSVNKSVDFSAEGTTNVVKPSLSKVPSNPTPPKPPNIQTVFKQKPDATDGSAFKEKTTEDSVPKIKPLPNVFALGKCPTKPKRPPHVDLGKFTSVSKQATDLSPPSDVYVVPCESEEINTAAQEESYDDVGVMKPPQSHPGCHWSNSSEAGVDEDLYEDLEERWADNEQTDTKTAAKEEQRKCDKEEKRRLEQEKKEQKAREKKEREARKKFKVSAILKLTQRCLSVNSR